MNNLGLLYLNTGRTPEALDVLSTADRECLQTLHMQRPTNAVCAYAWYNLGGVYLKLRKFADARTRFAKAIQYLEAHEVTPRSPGIDRRLLASAHQNMAFSLVMRSLEQSDPHERVRLANEAESAWRRGIDAFARAKVPAPALAPLTLARIHFARGEWKAALAVIGDLERKRVTDADVYLFASAANWCGGYRQNAAVYLQRFKEASTSPLEFSAGLRTFWPRH